MCSVDRLVYNSEQKLRVFHASTHFNCRLQLFCTARADMALLAESHSAVLNPIFSQRAQCSKRSHMVNVSASSRDNDDIQGGKLPVFQM